MYLPEGHENHAVYRKDIKVIVNTGLSFYNVESHVFNFLDKRKRG